MYYYTYYPVPQTPQYYSYWNPYYYSWFYAPYVPVYPYKQRERYAYEVSMINEAKRPEYPDVDATVFNESAIAFRKLLQEASLLLDKLADSKEFAQKLMSAAQESNTEEVDRLVKSTGIESEFKVTYTPDGIGIYLWSEVEETECCKLDMKIRWN